MAARVAIVLHEVMQFSEGAVAGALGRLLGAHTLRPGGDERRDVVGSVTDHAPAEANRGYLAADGQIAHGARGASQERRYFQVGEELGRRVLG